MLGDGGSFFDEGSGKGGRQRFSAPFFMFVRQKPVRQRFSDASMHRLRVVAGLCMEVRTNGGEEDEGSSV